MQVAVLVGGVADPKWPLPPDLSLASLQAHAARHASLSPFDEAALELALKLRDADPSARIAALVAGDDAFCRKVAGWRPDAIHRVDLAAVPAWDAGAVAAALAQAVRASAGDASHILIGREFGDWDDGSVAASLARAAGMPHVAMALSITAGDGLRAVRQSAGGLERVDVPERALLSVTNDPGNRLRHPLMKNVMLAKKAPIPAWQAPPPSSPVASCSGVQPDVPPARGGSCEWLQGSAQDKAQALARVLVAAAEG